MKCFTKLLVALALLASASGCAVNRATAMVDPTADLDKLKTLYVTKVDKDERGINLLVVDKLKARGLTVSTGPGKPDGVDAIVTYADKWTWDITMYMVDLTIAIRDPKSDFPFATGNSHHTSLTRKSPKEMVDEVIENIYKKGKN